MTLRGERPDTRRTTLLGLVAGLALLGFVSLLAGRVWIGPQILLQPDDPRMIILLELRTPRTLLALLIGAALGASGAAMQGYMRNPLADPGALGVSSTAALGAVLTLYLGVAAQSPILLAAAAMGGALAGVIALFMLAGAASGMVTFILAGVVLQTLGGAGVAVALTLAPDPWAVSEIVNWLMGSLVDRSLADVLIAAPPVVLGLLLLARTGPALDALTLGEAGAQSLGIDLGRTRLLLAAGVALATGASVAVSGVIGFVGLIVPHLLRPLVGARPSGLLAPSALGGAVLVLAADILVRLTPAAAEVRLGVAMSLLGAPFFLALLVSMRRGFA